MATSTLQKPIPYTYTASVAYGHELRIKTSAGTYNGIALMLFKATSNVGATSTDLCMITFFGNRENFLIFASIAGSSLPSSITVTKETGQMAIANTATSGSTAMMVTVLSDVENVLSFEVV